MQYRWLIVQTSRLQLLLQPVLLNFLEMTIKVDLQIEGCVILSSYVLEL